MKNPHEKREKAETEETRSRISRLSTVVIVHHSGPRLNPFVKCNAPHLPLSKCSNVQFTFV